MVANYKNPAFWRRGYQTLLATAVIAGALIGRVSPTQIPVAFSRIDRNPETPQNTQIIEIESQSPSVKSTASSLDTESIYAGGTTLLTDDSWRLYYESNR